VLKAFGLADDEDVFEVDLFGVGRRGEGIATGGLCVDCRDHDNREGGKEEA
jgi:hypothetical protein